MLNMTFEFLFNSEKFAYFLFFIFKLKIINLLITLINIKTSLKVQ